MERLKSAQLAEIPLQYVKGPYSISSTAYILELKIVPEHMYHFPKSEIFKPKLLKRKTPFHPKCRLESYLSRTSTSFCSQPPPNLPHHHLAPRSCQNSWHWATWFHWDFKINRRSSWCGIFERGLWSWPLLYKPLKNNNNNNNNVGAGRLPKGIELWSDTMPYLKHHWIWSWWVPNTWCDDLYLFMVLGPY